MIMYVFCVLSVHVLYVIYSCHLVWWLGRCCDFLELTSCSMKECPDNCPFILYFSMPDHSILYWLNIEVFTSRANSLDIIVASDIACPPSNTYVRPLYFSPFALQRVFTCHTVSWSLHSYFIYPCHKRQCMTCTWIWWNHQFFTNYIKVNLFDQLLALFIEGTVRVDMEIPLVFILIIWLFPFCLSNSLSDMV